jgi:hypothetical protein
MATANVSNTLVVPVESKVFPYHDDFNEDKNFHRILFRPGYGVQARELTQVQTILQNQIERFGNHVFTNGSPVTGGDIYILPIVGTSINLSRQYANTDIDVTLFQDKVVTINNGGSDDTSVKFYVKEVSEASADGNSSPTLFGDYLTSGEFFESLPIKVLGENIFANTASANVRADCQFVALRDSIFYFNGYFIKTPSQVAAFGKFNQLRSNTKLGIEFVDSIITENDDSSLLDPALEAFNYQAPGAARYKVELNLTSREIDSPDTEKFVELARIENGVLTKQTKFPIYAEIEEVLARRTFDESGNYTVKPFIINYDLDRYDPSGNVGITLSPGKAYVQGYEYETIAPTKLRIRKARTKNSVENFDLNMNYGNYVITSNLKGDFGATTMDLFDIHSIPYQFIDFTSNTTYQTTKVGTGKIKALEFYSGDTDVDTRKYEFYLFDTQFRSITSNIHTVSANTVLIYNSSSLLSANTNSYVNAVLRVTSGPGSGYSYNVVAYNQSTRYITIAGDFVSTPNNSSNVSVEFDFNDAHSFVKKVGYTPGATSNANTNITTLNKAYGTEDSPTFISESSLNTLVFPLPESWIANGITQQSYSYTKKFTSLQFTNGTSATISAGSNEDFEGASSSSNVSSTVMNNFLVVCSDKQTSSRANGEIVKVRTSVTSGSPEQVTFDTDGGASDDFLATIYAKMQFDPGVQPKIKTFSSANTRTFSAETPSTTFVNASGSNTAVYLSAGQVVIQNPSKRVGVEESLYISDVISVEKIYDLNGDTLPEGGYPLVDYTDVTNRYEFNNGQKDNFYDHASIKLKPSYAPCKGPLIVCCRYYNHTSVSGEGEYFIVDSYPNLDSAISEEGTELGDGYSLIPDHITTSGQVLHLRDCIDFRPKRTNATNTTPNFALTGIKVPNPTTDFQLNYDYYLGRRDLIVVNSNKTINIISGIPSKNPQDPSAPAKSMVIYSLGVEPYTKYPNNVSTKYVENKRYTMRDIGKIEKRVESLEYYVSLNTLEKSALDITIRDVDGLDRTKYGVLADNFTGHNLGRTDKIEEYQCSMDFKEGGLYPQQNTISYKLTANVALSSNVTFKKDKVILNYSEVPFVTQNLATKYAPVAEFLYSIFRGQMHVLPEADNWKSMNTAPDIILTDFSNTEITTVSVFQSIYNSQSRT